MTVLELIAALSEEHPNAEVFVVTDTGDQFPVLKCESLNLEMHSNPEPWEIFPCLHIRDE